MPPLTIARAPRRAAVSASVVSGLAAGSKIAARNMARPAMPAVQLFQRLSGKITREAPAIANRTRKASQLRRSRRRFTSLGASRTSAKRTARPRLRSRATVVSWVGSTGVEVVLITLRSGTVQCFSTCAGKTQKQFVAPQLKTPGPPSQPEGGPPCFRTNDLLRAEPSALAPLERVGPMCLCDDG